MKAYQYSDGVRFEDDSYSPAEGEIELPPLPPWDDSAQRIEWDGATWQVIPLNDTQLASKLNGAKAEKRTALFPTPNANNSQHISFTFPPYGVLTFATDHDTICNMLACSHVCERTLAIAPSMRSGTMQLTLAEGLSIAVQRAHIPEIVKTYCLEYCNKHIERAAGLRAIVLAPDTNSLQLID